MREYYELPDATGNTSSYCVSDPSILISNVVQDLLIKECMVTQVNSILSAHINLNNYINSILPEIENTYLQQHLEIFKNDTIYQIHELSAFVGEIEDDLISNESKHKVKSWKRDLSFVRSMQIMTGYILNFYSPAEKLAENLNYNTILNAISTLHTTTQELHNTITQISIQLILSLIHI